MAIQIDTLAQALAVVEEDRITDEQRKFEADYDAAQAENRSWDIQQTQKRAVANRAFFWHGLAHALRQMYPTITHVEVKEDDLVVFIGSRGLPARRCVSLHNWPTKVEVYNGGRGVGRRRSSIFRERKTGWNYRGIATDVAAFVKGQLRELEVHEQRESNKSPVATLKARLNMTEHSYIVGPSAVAEKPIMLKVNLQKAMTDVEAFEVVTFLREHGLVSEFEFNKKTS